MPQDGAEVTVCGLCARKICRKSRGFFLTRRKPMCTSRIDRIVCLAQVADSTRVFIHVAERLIHKVFQQLL